MEIMGKNVISSSKDIAHISNKIIESHYKHQLSIHEIKMISWIITEVQRENHFAKRSIDKYVNNIINISAKEYADIMGTSIDNFARDARKITSDLMGKKTIIETDNGWKAFVWVPFAEYVKNKATLQIRLSDELIPYIVNLPLYTKFRLENILRLGSSYAMKIYMLLVKFNGDDKGISGERTFKVDELRSILGISESGSYSLYADFKRKVLEISKREINKNTDLLISYVAIKNSRKVDTIKFKITQKEQEDNMIEAKK